MKLLSQKQSKQTKTLSIITKDLPDLRQQKPSMFKKMNPKDDNDLIGSPGSRSTLF